MGSNELLANEEKPHKQISLCIWLAQIGELSTMFALNHSLYSITDNKQIAKVNAQKLTYPPIETPAATRGIPGLRDLIWFTTSDKSSHFEAQYVLGVWNGRKQSTEI